MAQLASDTFDRADGGLGANWTTSFASAANPLIVSNAVHSPSAGNGARYTGGGIAWPNDQYSAVILGQVSTDTDNGAGPICRAAVGANTLYFAQATTLETRLYQGIAGTFTQLGSDAAPCAAGDLLELYCFGTYITVWRNKVLIIAANDAGIASGDAGILIINVGSDPQLRDWLGGSVLGPVVPDYSKFPKVAVRR